MLAKHTKHLSLVDVLSIGIDRIHRNFEPMKKQVEAWKATRIPDESAKLVIYRAFVEGELDVPKHLARRVHHLYFNPRVEEFAPRTTWSLSNAFTSGFKELDPILQFKATAKLASFLGAGGGLIQLVVRSRTITSSRKGGGSFSCFPTCLIGPSWQSVLAANCLICEALKAFFLQHCVWIASV